MAANPGPSLLARDVPSHPGKAYTAPHQRHTQVEYQYPPSFYTAPVLYHEPPKRSSSDSFSSDTQLSRMSSPRHSMDEGHPYQHTGGGGNGRGFVHGTGSLYPPPSSSHDQPRSFPEMSPRSGHGSYSSLEEKSSPPPPHYSGTHPPQSTTTYPSTSSSSSQAYHRPTHATPLPPSTSHQSSSPKAHPGLARLHDLAHTSHRPTVAAQGRAHSDTALTVPYSHPHKTPSQPPTTTSSYSSQASSLHSSAQQYRSNIPHFIGKANCSQATLENARYSLDKAPMADHPNEDRYFSLAGPNYKVFGVFDGHDGSRAAGFASNYMMQLFDTPSWTNISRQGNPRIVEEALGEFFRATEKDFFRSIQGHINEKEALQSRIPPVGLSLCVYVYVCIVVCVVQPRLATCMCEPLCHDVVRN